MPYEFADVHAALRGIRGGDPASTLLHGRSDRWATRYRARCADRRPRSAAACKQRDRNASTEGVPAETKAIHAPRSPISVTDRLLVAFATPGAVPSQQARTDASEFGHGLIKLILALRQTRIHHCKPNIASLQFQGNRLSSIATGAMTSG